ncbi:MAG: ABC transporter ATP-binding protein [Leptolyngbyaceae cyanobacterium MO_188.B28]|nr:ABC transporter ATP-binding protein [Leptolyngbyaceae cyanobacterium MO_188.B28]
MLGHTPRLARLVWQAAPGWLALSLTLTLIESLIPVGQLYVSKLIVDQVVIRISMMSGGIPADTPAVGFPPALAGLVGVGFALMLLQEVFRQSSAFVSQVLGDRFSLHANGILLEQAMRLDLTHFESSEFYDALNRAQQSGSQYPLRVLNNLTRLGGQVVRFLGLLALLLRFNPLVMGLLLLSSLPTFWLGVRYSNRRFWMRRFQTPEKRLSDYFGKILTEQDYVKEVRLFNLGQYLVGQYRRIRRRFNQESRRLAAQQAQAQFGIGVISAFGFYGAYGVVLWQTLQEDITIGDLTLYVGAFQQAQNSIQTILISIATVYEFNLYVSQFFEFLSLTPKVASPANPLPFPTPLKEGLVIDQVSFTYPGAKIPTLQDISLTVKPNECVALVGVNGSGKTTLLKLLTRFYNIDTGRILFDGIPLTSFDLKDLRLNIGVLFQDFVRYALNVEDNIGFGNLPQREDFSLIERAASDAGATEIIEGLAEGYQTVLGKIFKEGAELSGGQWQKIGLARAFISQAQILILDEPTAAVDAIAEHDLFQRFRQLTQGKMTFLVSHRFSTVRMADRIVVLDQGRIVEVGSHMELMAQEGRYARMFRLQAESYRMEGG